MSLRQGHTTSAIRLLAVLCGVAWLLGSSYCDLEALFDVFGAANRTAQQQVPQAVRRAAVQHNRFSETHSGKDGVRSSKKPTRGEGDHDDDDGDDPCCTKLHATPQTAHASYLSELSVQVANLFPGPSDFDTFKAIVLVDPPGRPPPSGAWVFTPEVCTGPANRSHAPPFLTL